MYIGFLVLGYLQNFCKFLCPDQDVALIQRLVLMYGAVHKVRQHFLDHFWHPPPPCQQLSAFQYPLPKKYVSIYQIMGNELDIMGWIFQIVSF